MSYFLNESFLVRGDEYYLAVCNKTGATAIYNEARSLFFSPFADGPVQFSINPDGSQNIKNLTRFGRSFSIIRIPYSLKLMLQELQVMNVQMRIITDENVDQLLSMSYSDNINKLLKEKGDLKTVVDKYTLNMKHNLSKDKTAAEDKYKEIPVMSQTFDSSSELSELAETHEQPNESPKFILKDQLSDVPVSNSDSPGWNPRMVPSTLNSPNSQGSPAYPQAYSPPYAPSNPSSPGWNPRMLPSTLNSPNSQSSPAYPQAYSPPYAPSNNSPPNYSIAPSQSPITIQINPSILDVEKPKDEEKDKKEDDTNNSNNNNNDKKVSFNTSNDSSSNNTSSGVKKITL
jgi:hypothetical protein